MTAPFLIRDMERDDREAAIALMQALNVFENRISGDRDTSRQAAIACLAADEERLRDHGGLRLVAEIGGKVEGYLCCTMAIGPASMREQVRSFALVSNLVVGEGSRDLGIGSALMAEAESFARAQGLRSLVVGHLAGNEGAGRLYERLGLKPHLLERIKWLD